MAESDEAPGRPPFDDQVAAGYVGKYILVGITYVNRAGDVLRQQQLHGTIASATEYGITIELKGTRAGDQWNMPPDLGAIFPADPGSYRLRETGEVIENPDLLSNWTVTEPTPTH
jgi:hypothetical protein